MQIAPQTCPNIDSEMLNETDGMLIPILSFALPTLACSALTAYVGLRLSDKTLTFTMSASL